jgi:hypothetical protein
MTGAPEWCQGIRHSPAPDSIAATSWAVTVA